MARKKQNKKLFISCPMNGLTEEMIKKNMEKMHKIAEVVFEQPLDVINTYFEDIVPAGINVPVYFLGKSIMVMSEANYFIGIRYDFLDKYPGCNIESDVAGDYEIPSFLVDTDYLTLPESDKNDKK